MLKSHIIDINSVIAGVAIQSDRGFRFIAVDLRVEELDATVWPSLEQVSRLARRLFLTGGFADRAVPNTDAANGGSPRAMA
jgi:hypothetical protein